MEKLLILWILLTNINEIVCDSTTLNGILGATVNSISFNYTWNSSVVVANIAYRTINLPKSNALLVVSSSPLDNLTLTPEILSQYNQNNSYMLQNMDLQSCISGNDQMINLFLSSNIRVLYFVLFNFDLPNVQTMKSYEVYVRVVTYYQILCEPCPSGAYLLQSLSYCKCFPCGNNYYGSACQNYEQPIYQDVQYDQYIQADGNFYYRIINPPSVIELHYKLSQPSAGVTLYMQYETVVGNVAGYLNTYYDSNHVPFSKKVTIQDATTLITTNGMNISLTLTSYQGTNTGVTIFYRDPSKTTDSLRLILGISIGVTGAVIIIILIVYLCKRKRQHQVKNTRLDQYFLSGQQIDKYFPSVEGSLLVNDGEADKSYEQLNLPSDQSARKQINSIQCAVCLCEIKATDQIRVAYCRHYFHSACLVGWFAKNQNCPVCRKECNRDETQDEYYKIKKSKGKVKGRSLVEAILDYPKKRQIFNEKQLQQKNIGSDCLSFEQSCNRQHSNTITKIQLERVERQTQPRNGPEIITFSVGEEQIVRQSGSG